MDKIASMFDMRPIVEANRKDVGEYLEPSTDLVPTDEGVDKYLEEANEDFIMARTKIKSMIEEAGEVFETAKIAAVSSGEAKQLDAFSKVMDTVVKASKELMSIHKEMFGLQPPIKEDVAPQSANTINNIIFTGTGADLIRLLREKGVGNVPTIE